MSEFPASDTSRRVDLLENNVSKLTSDVDRLAKSLDTWSGKVEQKLDSIETKVGSVGTISSKTVFNGTIGLIGALNLVFVAAVTLGVVYVGLRTDPINDKIDEEIKDRKLTDIEVSKNGREIASLKSDLNGLRTYQDTVSQINNWFNFYHQGQIDALKSTEMNRGN